MHRKLPLYLALLTLTQCSSCKDDPQPANPLSQLPPPTQTGANTFGCLVNGQAYTPQGYNGTPNYVVLYETGPAGANLSIRTYRYANGGKIDQSFAISAGPVTRARTFILSLARTEGTADYDDQTKPSPCNEYFSYVNYLNGNLTLTRVDEQAGIIAGTFECTIAQPGCDTLRITNGRFDHKI